MNSLTGTVPVQYHGANAPEGIRTMSLIAVDLDGTIAQSETISDPYKIAYPMPGAVEFLNKLASQYQIMIHTARINDSWGVNDPEYSVEKVVESIHEWLDKHGMPLCQVWTGRGKPLASLFLDDRAITCGPDNYYELLSQLIAPHEQ